LSRERHQMFKDRANEYVFGLPLLGTVICIGLAIWAIFIEPSLLRNLMWLVSGCSFFIIVVVFSETVGSLHIYEKHAVENISSTVDKNLINLVNPIKKRFAKNSPCTYQVLELGNFCILLLHGMLIEQDVLEADLSERFGEKVKLTYHATYRRAISHFSKDKRGGNLEIKIGDRPAVIAKVW
jgi:hypothetical protein